MDEEINLYNQEEKNLDLAIQINTESEKDYVKEMENFKNNLEEINKNKLAVNTKIEKLTDEQIKRQKVFEKFHLSNQK